MPRGKNYVNQNTGMKLQGKEQVKELCFYGNACTRKDCIYRHDRTSKVIVGNLPKSYTDPCMAYLAGYCAFDDTTCRKYHPTSEDEVNVLVQKYNNIPCKFTIHCKTKGCLYKHVDPNRIVPMIPQSQSQPSSPMMAMMMMMMHPNYQNNHSNHNTFTNHTFPPLTTKPNPVWSDPNAFPPLSTSSKTTVSSNVVPPNHATSSTSSSVITTVTTSSEDATQKSKYDSHYGPSPVTSNITTPSTLSSSSSSSILKPVVPIDYRIKNRNIHHNDNNSNSNNNNNNNNSGSRITTTNNTNVMYHHHHNNNYQNGHVPPQHNHHVHVGHDNDVNPPTHGTSFNITAKEFIPGGASHAYRPNGN